MMATFNTMMQENIQSMAQKLNPSYSASLQNNGVPSTSQIQVDNSLAEGGVNQ
jgi:hypothetical protein